MKTARQIFEALSPADRDCMVYDHGKYMQNLFTGNVVYNESFLPIAEKDGTVKPIRLMYPVDKVLALRDGTLSRTYTEGVDFTVEGGCICLTKNTTMPYMRWEEYFVAEDTGYAAEEEGRFLFLREGNFYHRKQFAVSYIHEATWDGPVPQNKMHLLPKTYQKLKNGEPLRVVMTGASLAVGGNNSALTGIAPYCPNWIDMTVEYWRKAFGTDITLTNLGKGGVLATYGMTVMPETLAANPDLVVIHFGGNDSYHNVPLEKYLADLRALTEAVQAHNPDCEFIHLSGVPVSPLLKRKYSALLRPYREALYALEKEGVAVADVTRMHDALLKRKVYADMMGNGISHINDFFTRVYAQTVGFMLTDEGATT